MTNTSRRPLSPEAAAVVRALGQGRLSRRSVLGASGAAGLGALLSACGTGSGTGSTPSASSSGAVPSASGSGSAAPAQGPAAAADKSDAEKVVNWANWTLYLDYDDASKTYPTLEAFQKESGLTATYAEDIEDNETYYGKIQAQLRQGQDIGKDIITLTDWMAARLVKAGWTQKLDQANIPNGKNILPTLKGDNVGWDPNRDFSYTWQSGFGGFGYDAVALEKATGLKEMKTLDDLWNPKLAGRIEVLSEMRDTMGIILMAQGVKLSGGITSAQWSSALEVLDKQISSGQIRQVKGNSYKEDLVSGDAIAVIGWSGDLFQLQAENPDKGFQFVIPESGGTLWSDNLLVPIGSPHKKNAEALINYYYDPKVAAEVAAYVNYICPVQGAKEEIVKLEGGAELAKSENIFPSAATLAKVQSFPALDAAQEKEFTTAFQKVLGV